MGECDFIYYALHKKIIQSFLQNGAPEPHVAASHPSQTGKHPERGAPDVRRSAISSRPASLPPSLPPFAKRMEGGKPTFCTLSHLASTRIHSLLDITCDVPPS